MLPALVVWPESTEDIIIIVNKCRELRVPLTARGTGSSFEGNAIPARGGVVVDMTRMNALIETRSDDLICRVQPGVLYSELNQQLSSYGLFLPMSPSTAAELGTVGGMVAKNATGIYALKYGSTGDAVLGLTAVTGAAEVIRAGHRARKASAGYDLTSLVVGSEGTLAIVTEITLGLERRPAETLKLSYTFKDEGACAAAVVELVGHGVELAACEYLDARCMAVLNEAEQYDVQKQPGLLLEIHADSGRSAVEIADAVGTLVHVHGAVPLHLQVDPWVLRSSLSSAVLSAHPGTSTIRADIAFPVSLFPEVVELARHLALSENVQLYTFGHAGQGILQLMIQESPEDFLRWEVANDVKEHLIEFVVDRGGSCSGGHGIGLGNKCYMQREHGMAIDVMSRVKTVFDPDGILNPGKILP
jgi:D-lactate dehydrogenase (cytochrome)